MSQDKLVATPRPPSTACLRLSQNGHLARGSEVTRTRILDTRSAGFVLYFCKGTRSSRMPGPRHKRVVLGQRHGYWGEALWKANPTSVLQFIILDTKARYPDIGVLIACPVGTTASMLVPQSRPHRTLGMASIVRGRRHLPQVLPDDIGILRQGKKLASLVNSTSCIMSFCGASTSTHRRSVHDNERRMYLASALICPIEMCGICRDVDFCQSLRRSGSCG
ncbi:uncharacterized protein C8Q71DRAFT_273924 [Rhodofomes roseus]|uniref:Uncharacterized protein n=1 Tax=Rhodofomes roseus TaxID=34475 RepID=A0ABQ8K4R0_9APHY|nr:uncharacterized protein C8Q71DRAFT_273924 [Rhodofomes roseus]KAH9831947.1 hypothetical protein C8Q71DRAFT_273924 [Rhodofomes roseus]